jgi:hypothetical protein
VPADAIALLRAGCVWSVTYDGGRLLGEVGLWDIAAAPDPDAFERWAQAKWPVYEQVRASIVARDEREQQTADRLRARLRVPPGHPTSPLTDEPLVPVAPDEVPNLWTYLWSGDLAGSRAALANAIAAAEATEAAGVPYPGWPRLAACTRLFTSDDDAAAAMLTRLRFADARRDWADLFGPPRIAREQAEVLAVIDRAFDGVPFPGPTHRSLYQAEAADSYAGCDQSRDHRGRWQELPDAHLLDCQCALPFLDADGLHYYLPAIMSFAAREPRDAGPRAWLCESLEYNLARYRDEPARYERLTPAQHDAVARFIEFYVPTSALVR